MRKFRVWDYTLRQWQDASECLLNGYGFVYRREAQGIRLLEENGYQVEFDTGFKDSKKQRVFENDILDIDGGHWLVQYTESNGRWDLIGLGKMRGEVAHIWHASMGVVIGDLHHNLELAR